jgi:hypothetical protein
LLSAKSAAAASLSEAAAAASRSPVYNLNYDNKDNNDHSCSSISSKSSVDDSVVVVNKPPARPEGKIPLLCIPGDVLQIMQYRLNANASRASIDSWSYRTQFKTPGPRSPTSVSSPRS